MPLQPSRNSRWLAPVLSACLVAALGCEPAATGEADAAGSDGHGHHHDHSGRPDSLHEVVERLAEIEHAVSDAITSGDADAAHGPLHEVGELLKAIPDIAAETDLPKPEWEAVKSASERLMDAYGEIDHAFHIKDGDKQAAFTQVAEDLTDALDEIRSRLPLTGEQPEEHDHDEYEYEYEHEHDEHDEHDHDDHDEHDHDAELNGSES